MKAKLTILLLALFVLTSVSVKAQQIELGGWNNGDWDPNYIPKAVLDTVACLTHIPEGYSVKSFAVSVSINDKVEYAISNSSKLTSQQRDILNKLKVGDNVYIENIVLINDSTKSRKEWSTSVCKIVDNPTPKAITHNIELGGWNTGEWNPIFIPKSALDTISCLTHIPEGYSIKKFNISAIVDGSTVTGSSNSSKLTMQQRGIINELKIGDKVYIEDIILVNNATKQEHRAGAKVFKVVGNAVTKNTTNDQTSSLKNSGRRISANICLGMYNAGNRYIPQSAVDSDLSLTNIPENYYVNSFKISAFIKGFNQEYVSNSHSVTDRQKNLISQVPTGEKIYVENIKLVDRQTDEIVTADVFYLIKDGVNARGDWSQNWNWEGYEDDIHPHIYAYPSLTSKDWYWKEYIVQSFRIEAVNPDYVFSLDVEGNQIDSVTYSHLTKLCHSYWVKNIRCREVSTGKDVYAPDIEPTNGNTGFLYRSKDYFLKSNSKIDFFYKQDFKIDSVQVKERTNERYYYTPEYNVLYKFNGDIFPKDLKAIIKKTKLFSILTFSVFHSGKMEDVEVIIVE